MQSSYPGETIIENQPIVAQENIKKFCDVAACPVRNIVSRFSTKWGLLVIAIVNDAATVRFSELRRHLPDISPKVLASTLKTLQADGIITKKVYAEIPPRTQYTITPLGRELAAILGQLTAWALDHADEIMAHRRHAEP